MEALLVSTLVVAIGEIGDKTQLLALVLAVRLRRPLPIVLGILVATVANHSIAGLVGDWVSRSVPPDTLRWVLGASFIAIGLWAIAEADRILAEQSKSFGPLININKAIRDGLS